jgi:hypothetical protein
MSYYSSQQSSIKPPRFVPSLKTDRLSFFQEPQHFIFCDLYNNTFLSSKLLVIISTCVIHCPRYILLSETTLVIPNRSLLLTVHMISQCSPYPANIPRNLICLVSNLLSSSLFRIQAPDQTYEYDYILLYETVTGRPVTYFLQHIF